MKLKPLDNRVIVRPERSPQMTAGGLALPDVARKRPVKGEVLAVGPGLVLSDGGRAGSQLRTGQVVYFAETAVGPHNRIGEGESAVFVLAEHEILAAEEPD